MIPAFFDVHRQVVSISAAGQQAVDEYVVML